MNELLNLKNKKINQKETQKTFTLKFRREMIGFTAKTPKYIQNFCKKFIKNDRKLLKELKQEIENNEELKNFLTYNEIIWRYKIIENEFDFRKIFRIIFGKDLRYERNALKLAKHTGFFSLEYIYLTMNYINDNFPIKIKRKLNKKEKSIIKFLIYRGDELDFLLKYKMKKEFLTMEITKICDNYGCKNINSVLNFVLIEKYFRKENIMFLESLNSQM